MAGTIKEYNPPTRRKERALAGGLSIKLDSFAIIPPNLGFPVRLAQKKRERATGKVGGGGEGLLVNTEGEKKRNQPGTGDRESTLIRKKKGE